MRRIMMIISAIFAMNLFSCSPLRHYKKVSTDISVTEEKRQIIAPWVSLNFPVKAVKGDTIETLVIDTVETKGDDIVQIILDTVTNIETKVTYKDRIITKTITRTITDTVEGTATVDALRSQLATSSEQIAQLKEKVEGEKQKTSAAKSAKKRLLWIIIAIAALTAIWIGFKAKSFFAGGGVINKIKGWV